MSNPLVVFGLIAALAVPSLAEARQDEDFWVAAKLAAAYQRGRENHEEPTDAKEVGMCASAWSAVWRIYNAHPNYSTPSDLSVEDIEWQSDRWDDRADKAGEDGEAAMQAADEALFNPWFDAGDYERIMEFAGACGEDF
jgi:hypothetical protein